MPTFDSDIQRFGLPGASLNLRDAVDVLPPGDFSRLVNVDPIVGPIGGLTGRAGQTSLLSLNTSTLHHSAFRLSDPLNSAFIRLIGYDTSLGFGTSGTLTNITTGFSGNPFTFAAARPPLSGATYAYVGDSSKMVKVDASGASSPIGIAFPTNAATVAVDTNQTTTIEAMNATTGWTASGFGGAGTPTLSTTTDPAGNTALTITSNITSPPTTPLIQAIYKALTVDLSKAGTQTATDDDYIVLEVSCNAPQYLTEIKIYLTVSTYSAGTIPGWSGTVNTDAYVTSIRPADIEAAFASTSTTSVISAQQTQATNQSVGAAVQALLATGDPSTQLGPGAGTWTQFGQNASFQIRRGNFLRLGDNSAKTWATVTGIYVVFVCDNANQITVGLYDMYLAGGYGPDSGVASASGYDWRYTHYDPATGAESNPSPIMASTQQLYRQGATVTPTASGTSSFRQRFYRRGGTLPTDWFFLGVNASDGGTYDDTLSDTSIEAASTLAIDNDQPVTTVQNDGTVVYAQPIPVVFGPVNAMLLGCGDKYRPGYLYFSKPGLYDAWPAANFIEVCSPSEELMNGCVYGAQAYVFSRQRLYVVYPDLTATGTLSFTPTACTHGLVSRWGMATGSGAIWFVSDDGIYMTSGDREVNITDEKLYPLFHGVAANGLNPIDFTVPAAIQLAVANNNLYFIYQDTGGTRRMLVYSILLKCWREYDFATPISGLYAETLGAQQYQLLLGGVSSGTTYTHSGTSDGGSAIASVIRTGSRDQGAPRQDKFYMGDLALDAALTASTLTITPYYNNEVSTGTVVTLTGAGTRTRSFAKVFPSPLLARNLAFDYSWSTTAAPPTFYWQAYSWLVEPIEHLHAETDVLDHGIPGWQVPTYFYATLRSTATVTLTVITYAASGTAIATDTYSLASTGGAKQKLYAPLNARRGLFFHYALDSTAAFKVYWEESQVGVVPWHRGKTAIVYPLGTEMPSPLTRFIHPDFESLRLGGD